MVFPQSLTPRGTGLPDFQSGVQAVSGSLQVYGSINIANRLGTVGHIGSLGRVERVGTAGYLTRVGTVQRIQSVGTVRNIVAGQDILTGADVQARLLSGTVLRDRIPLGQGSTWIGSWQDIANYKRKTYVFRSPGTPGSFAAIVGATGSGVRSATGTIYSRRIAQGSYGTYSFDDAFSFTRPWFRRSGGTFRAGRGSVTVALTRQA